MTCVLLVHQLLLLLVLHDGGVRGLLTRESTCLSTWDALAEISRVHKIGHLLLMLLLLLLLSGGLVLSRCTELVDLGGCNHMVRARCVSYRFRRLELPCEALELTGEAFETITHSIELVHEGSLACGILRRHDRGSLVDHLILLLDWRLLSRLEAKSVWTAVLRESGHQSSIRIDLGCWLCRLLG